MDLTEHVTTLVWVQLVVWGFIGVVLARFRRALHRLRADQERATADVDQHVQEMLRFRSASLDLTADLARVGQEMCDEDRERLRLVLVVHAEVLLATNQMPQDVGLLDADPGDL